MSEISITDVRAAGSQVRADVECSRELRRFFGEDTFFVEYGVDVSAVPERILTIPVLAHVCPVAWATGADVRVPVVDERYLDSLRSVRSTLREMYPSLMGGGRIVVDDVRSGSSARSADPSPADTDGSDVAALFTGGVDSLATYVRHREERPTLVNVQGWVIGLDETDQWNRTKRVVESYGDRFGVETQFVRSNMLSFLDWRMLVAHFNRHHNGGWYSAVACGLGLSGLCAPLTVTAGYERLYMAATKWDGVDVPEVVDHWDGRGTPWGSHPTIVNEIGWAGTAVTHDGFELTRQQRVGVIADFIRETGRSELPIHSCNDTESGANCNQCEKCFRTAFGLALEGIDPNDHGFRLTPDHFERARSRLASGDWTDREHDVYWRDMQRNDGREAYPVDGAAAFFEWFQSLDIDAVVASSNPPVRQRAIRTALRNVPYPVYNGANRVYSTLLD